ncbi:hypothetical protein RA2_04350 [Roseovarius sp. A-2]|nr:hypothetical protein RA2_04350 [Roseovarius sp. A-2]
MTQFPRTMTQNPRDGICGCGIPFSAVAQGWRAISCGVDACVGMVAQCEGVSFCCMTTNAVFMKKEKTALPPSARIRIDQYPDYDGRASRCRRENSSPAPIERRQLNAGDIRIVSEEGSALPGVDHSRTKMSGGRGQAAGNMKSCTPLGGGPPWRTSVSPVHRRGAVGWGAVASHFIMHHRALKRQSVYESN